MFERVCGGQGPRTCVRPLLLGLAGSGLKWWRRRRVLVMHDWDSREASVACCFTVEQQLLMIWAGLPLLLLCGK